MSDCEVLIIGGGIIGCTIAEKLSAHTSSLYLLEKNSKAGQETSSRNSEVIHSGIYYPQNSLKHLLCIKGNKLLYRFCIEHNIPFEKSGKLIVAANKDEISVLEKLYKNALKNNVKAELWDKDKIKKSGEDIQALQAIYSSETGIINSHSYLQKIIELSPNVNFVYNKEVSKIEKQNNAYKVYFTENGTSSFITSKYVINASGLYSDKTAPFQVNKKKIEQYFYKGSYYYIKKPKEKTITHLVYPVVKAGSNHLGIHLTKELGGAYKIGPDSVYLPEKKINYYFDESSRHKFYLSAKKYLPWLKEDSLSPGTTGIRPKLSKENSNFADFYINEESKNNLSGYIHLAGIDSPGLTASLAIAEYVEKIFLNLRLRK